MSDLASLRVVVYGRVQGVYFRAFTLRHAIELELTGYVQNLPHGKGVEVQAEGERDELQKLLDYLKLGPPTAKIDKVVTTWSEYTGNYANFTIKY